jgi:ribonuclease VapC
VTRVVDASALFAFLLGESGAEVVEERIEESAVSTVNWSEVCQRASARGVDTAGLRGDVETLGVSLEPFTADDAEQAAELWQATRASGLSLGDRACLALARRLGVTAVTADRAWLGLEVGVDVSVIR